MCYVVYVMKIDSSKKRKMSHPRNKITANFPQTQTTKINTRRVAETQMVSVRKRNIQVDTIVYLQLRRIPRK